MCSDIEVIKFELYGDNEIYYTLSEMEMQNFADWEGREVLMCGIALNGLPPAALPLSENKHIFVDYGNVMSDPESQF